MSFLAWIDFDQADRDRTRRIMDLFDSEDSRDELGLGSVRDALSDLLFPGTSTIQTRLRYFLFVPWIYRIAGAHSGTAAGRRDLARSLEIRLIDALKLGGETRGVIGSAAGERLKRLPSDVYWAGLHTLGIRRFQGSRSAYLEASPGDSDALWASGLPAPPEEFLSTDNCAVSLALSQEEAGFIRDRLTHETPNSLFTWLARQDEAPECDMIWQHPFRTTWPSAIQEQVDHAMKFSMLMHGAALLYNLLLSERAADMQGAGNSIWHQRAQDYSGKLQLWATETPLELFVEWDLDDLWLTSLGTSHKIGMSTRRFIENWRAFVLKSEGKVASDPGAISLVKEREKRLKGAKSRFRNDGALSRWSGASGTSPLNYRWSPVVAGHLKDLTNV